MDRIWTAYDCATQDVKKVNSGNARMSHDMISYRDRKYFGMSLLQCFLCLYQYGPSKKHNLLHIDYSYVEYHAANIDSNVCNATVHSYRTGLDP